MKRILKLIYFVIFFFTQKSLNKTSLNFFSRSSGKFANFFFGILLVRAKRVRYTRECTLLRVSLLPFLSISNVFYLLLTSSLSYFVSVACIAILSPKAMVLMRSILTRFNYNYILFKKKERKIYPDMFQRNLGI